MASGSQSWTGIATIRCYVSTKFHAIPLHGFGERHRNISPHNLQRRRPLPCVYIFQWGQNETLPAQKLKELQGPKSRFQPLPRDAMLPQNEMCFRCTVLEKWHQDFSPYKLHGGILQNHAAEFHGIWWGHSTNSSCLSPTLGP